MQQWLHRDLAASRLGRLALVVPIYIAKQSNRTIFNLYLDLLIWYQTIPSHSGNCCFRDVGVCVLVKVAEVGFDLLSDTP